jgi:hypothetical protein
MQEAIEEFIKYTELSEPTLEGRILQYQQLLRNIATGSWRGGVLRQNNL